MIYNHNSSLLPYLLCHSIKNSYVEAAHCQNFVNNNIIWTGNLRIKLNVVYNYLAKAYVELVLNKHIFTLKLLLTF